MVCHQESVIVGVEVVTTTVYNFGDEVCRNHYIYRVEITQMKFSLIVGASPWRQSTIDDHYAIRS